MVKSQNVPNSHMKHTPYDGSSKPFTIGLTQLDPDRWIEPDEALDFYLSEKARLLSASREEVFAAEDRTETAQRELVDLLTDYLPHHYPELYRRENGAMIAGGRRVALDGDVPIVVAGSLIQDDLAILERKEGEWRLTAAYVAFPSSWSLREKFGRTLDEIHAPVPGFYSDPVAALRNRPDAAALARSFIGQLNDLTPPQAAYKGLVSKREALISALLSIAG
ncbi:NADH dehydrogenase [Sinorhizobium americanum CCGM7]|uniref:heme-dependent oxidative N-demethylase family protein n=1 Tax=Sinorhizobium americanum TaxID=194963 RepID=UPI0004D59D92|nr:DUF3445 domain-containing protein [Sinorhizobium americanum]APG85826.1 NADH dehydrogenase [Sinorhizobium americanum CCGM7]